MRIGFLLLMVVVLGSLGVWVVWPARATVGMEMAAGLEKEGSLRGAIQLVDWEVEGVEGRLEGERGRGEVVGVAGEREWVKGKGFEFVWRVGGGSKLREAVEEKSEAVRRVRGALVGRSVGSVDRWVAGAVGRLNGMTEEGVLEAWVAADRGVLVGREEGERAVEEAVLLCARGEVSGAGVVTFLMKEGRVYLLPLLPTAGREWVEVEGYDLNGKMAWSGVLSVEVGTEARRVRMLAARGAAEAWRGIK